MSQILHAAPMAQPAATIAALASRFEELTSALAATYDPVASSNKDTVQRLAAAREQLLEACTQLRDQLVRLKQAAMLSPQHIDDLLQRPQAEPKQGQAAAGRAQQAAGDSMDVDQQSQPQDQQPGSSASELAAAITQQHAQFLSKLVSSAPS